ncbi:MAG: lipoyl synthase [Formosa sp.]|mgnify:FL=1|nr:lipoyl synthase [Formosa sp.]|tara:strand:- start:20023 stop:21006 length:984 start_codon:yes stop_codon:yes gene_type:complete
MSLKTLNKPEEINPEAKLVIPQKASSINSFLKPEDITASSVITRPQKRQAKPKWLRVKLPTGKKYTALRGLVDKYKLNTICTSGSCPNMGECWGEGTATFMILGNICTRSCGFCGVKTGRPETVDWEEPEKVAKSIKIMGIKHAVLTSVDRDDLKDMGSIIWSETVSAVRRMNPGITLETLIPDFQGLGKHIDRIIDVAPEVVSHNMETVRRLTREVRIQAKYERSLSVLKYLKDNGQRRTKTGLMLGLGETRDEVIETLQDLKDANVDVLTIGQYLQPSKRHLPVKQFITPDQFKEYETIGLDLGFRHVESSALVRSSYKAQKHIH